MSHLRGQHGRRSRSGRAVLLTAVAGLALVGCGRGSLTSDTATATVQPMAVTAPPTLAATITISGFNFGAPVTVHPGQVVTVVNADPAAHTVTADDKHSFDVSVAPNGRTFLTAPATAGSYAYTCIVHPMMHGTLIVR